MALEAIDINFFSKNVDKIFNNYFLRKPMSGKFITLEGVEGSGKSTQWQLLGEHLAKQNKPHILLREPGATPLGENIRNLLQHDHNVNISPIAEAYLFAASRAQLVSQVIQPALAQGKLVICDRFIDSSLVYQGIARGLGIDTIANINQHAIAGTMPHVTIFLDVPVSVSLERINSTKVPLDRIESEGIAFHTALYNGYKKQALQDAPHGRIITIDGTLSKQGIHSQITSTIQAILTPKGENNETNSSDSK